jgi:hypothetical protein
VSPRPPLPPDPRRSLALAAVLVLGVATAIGSGGGGGGDDGAGISDEPAPPFPSRVQYVAGSPADFAGSGVDMALDIGGSVHTGFFLEGTYAKGTGTFTLAPHGVPRITVTTTGLPFALRDDPFGIRVMETVRWTATGRPVSGMFRTATPDHVRVTLVSDVRGTGLAGVLVEQVGSGVVVAAVSLTWDELDAVLDNPAAFLAYVVQGAFAEAVLERVGDQLRIGLDAIEFITLNDPDLTAAGDGGPVTRPCDPFPFSGTTGGFDFTWNDGPGAFPGALGPGDNFAVAFDDCWSDDPDPGRDLWLEAGGAELLDYLEDPFIVALGFEQVILRDLVETRTEEVAGVHTPVGTVTVDSFGIAPRTGFRLMTVPDTSGAIHAANALDVAGAAVSALLLPREVADLALEMLAGTVADPAFDPCGAGGMFAVDPAPTPARTAPVSFDFTFTACAIGGADPVTYDGGATLNVTDLGGATLGALLTGDHAVDLTTTAVDVTTTDALGPSRLTGAGAFARTAVAGNLVEAATSLAPGLSVTEDGVTALLSAYDVASTLASGGAYTLGAAGDLLTLDPGIGTGPLTVTVEQAVQGTDPEAPLGGTLRVEAQDGAVLTVTVASGAVTVTLDTDGDGTVDDTRTTTWADLT